MFSKPKGSVKTGKVSDKHNLGRMPKEKLVQEMRINQPALKAYKTQEDDTTDDPSSIFVSDPRGKGLIYNQKPQHRLPGEQSFNESTMMADLLGVKDKKERALMMEDERRESVVRAGDKSRKERLARSKPAKKPVKKPVKKPAKKKAKGGKVNKTTVKKRANFSGKGAGVALRGF